MKIKKIEINKYKSITDPLVIDNLSNLHILVGPNNAGKTNLLDAIHLFFKESNDQERFFDEKTKITLSLVANDSEYVFNYKGKEIINNKEKISQFKKRFKRIVSDSTIYNLIPQEIKEFKSNYPQEYNDFSIALQKHFKDVEINEELFVLSVHADHVNRPIKRMGEGFKRLFVILFYVFHPQYDIILIDEPELHLHPSIIKKFLALLTERELKNQIFLTTHHPAFIQADYLKYVWRVTRNENESTVVCGFSKADENVDRLVQEINDDNSSMLFTDKVLLVEGVSDYVFMKEILKKFYKKEKEIKVIYTGGKGSIDIYSNLCEHFKIPYSVMLDRDALDSPSVLRIKKYPVFNKKTSDQEKIQILKEKEIFVLNRSLEDVFPKKFKKKETKPLTSLYVSRQISENDLNNKRMSIIKDILEII